MSDKRYEANIIRATAVEPADNFQSTSAPVWSLDDYGASEERQMAYSRKFST